MENSTVDCLVVMQPTFLPWAGYFNLISEADVFVFLDDVQLEKQSWQTRNKLLLNGREDWISLPIQHTHLEQIIRETQPIKDQRWLRKTIERFNHSYRAHPYYSEAFGIFNILKNSINMNLSDLNQEIILYISEKLKIETVFHRSSNLRIKGYRSERLASLCNYFNAKEYLSPAGSSEYLAEDTFTEKTESKLRFQKFSPSKYHQKGTSEFVSHLSIVDVVANLGWSDTRKYIIGSVK